MNALEIPETVRRKALLRGGDGEAWLASLPELVGDLAGEWTLDLGRTLGGGTESLVIEAQTAEGRAAVLKLATVSVDPTANELRTLLAANGRGYADVLRHDRARGAMLMERLGPQLSTLGLGYHAETGIICENLVRTWRPPPPGEAFTTGGQKAVDLAAFIQSTWRELGAPCEERTVDRALAFTKARGEAFDPQGAVLAHGDAHASNTLLAPDEGPNRFKFVDPDGLFIEPAYDLAIPMRDGSAELLAGDPLELGMRRCRRLSAITGVAPEPIWQWGFIERVSTGLLLLKMGMEDSGREFLTVADTWALGYGP